MNDPCIDNLTDAEFIGIFDTDAIFTTPVMVEDLFDFDEGQVKPKIMGISQDSAQRLTCI